MSPRGDRKGKVKVIHSLSLQSLTPPANVGKASFFPPAATRALQGTWCCARKEGSSRAFPVAVTPTLQPSTPVGKREPEGFGGARCKIPPEDS